MNRNLLLFVLLSLAIPSLFAQIPETRLFEFDPLTPNSLYGKHVSVSGDTLVVGAPTVPADVGGGGNSPGAVYIYNRVNGLNGSAWVLNRKLLPSDLQPKQLFGWSVRLRGNTLMVGAPDWRGTAHQEGRIYVYQRIDDDWVETQTLTHPNPQSDDSMGVSLDFDANHILSGGMRGSWFFKKDGDAWTFEQSIPYPGWEAALEGNLAAVGVESGYVTVFEFGTSWNYAVSVGGGGNGVDIEGGVVYAGLSQGGFVYRFRDPNNGNQWGFGLVPPLGGEDMSSSIAVCGRYLLTGNKYTDSAYLYFNDPATGWTRVRHYQSGSPINQNQYLGESVALSERDIVIGATYISNFIGGSVYLASYPPLPDEVLKPTNPNSQPQDHFGYSVAISGNTLAVGARDDSVSGAFHRGSVYMYRRVGNEWLFDVKIEPVDYANSQVSFGQSVALEGDTLMVGAPQAGSTDPISSYRSGCVYLYQRINGVWQPDGVLFADIPEYEGKLGSSIAFDGDRAVAGGARKTWVFKKTNGVWRQEQILSATPGLNVAIEGELLSATADNRAKFYKLRNNVWESLGALPFVRSVEIKNGEIYTTGRPEDGAFTVYQLVTDDSWISQSFGDVSSYQHAISISDDGQYVLVTDDYLLPEGKARLFSRGPQGGWELLSEFEQATARMEGFGISNAVSDAFAVIGATYDGDSTPGRVYVNAIVRSEQPSRIDLDPASDSGASNSDGISNHNNASAAKALNFIVSGTVPGATVHLYNVITNEVLATAVADSNSLLIRLDVSIVPADGEFSVYARQTEPDKLQSPFIEGFMVTLTIDTEVPEVGPAVLDGPSDSGIWNDNVTNVAQPDIQVTQGVEGLKIYDGGVLVDGVVVADALARLPAQTEGEHVYTLQAEDVAGNRSPLSELRVTFDYTPPRGFLETPPAPIFSKETFIVSGLFDTTPVEGIEEDDVVVTNADAMFSNVGTSGDFIIFITASKPGVVTVKLRDGAGLDSVGNPSTSAEVTFSVIAKDPQLVWNSNADPMSYGTLVTKELTGLAHSVVDAPGTFTYTPPFGTLLPVGEHLLKAQFTPDDPDAYAAGTVTLLYKIKPALLVVHANDAEKTAGTPNPDFSASYFGFVNNETAAVLGAPVTFATEATTNSPQGLYDIVPSGAAVANYTFFYQSGVLTVKNGSPQVSSTPAATPNPARSGQIVTFFASATDPDGHPLTYTWNFGDGSTSSGPQVLHTYTFPGVYAAQATISDPFGGVRVVPIEMVVVNGDGARAPDGDWDGDGQTNESDPDDDNDGFSDELETLMGSSTTEKLLTPMDPAQMQSLTIQKLSIKLAFLKPGIDSLDFAGLLPLPSVAGQTVAMDFGGIVRMFNVNAKGTGAAENAQLRTRPKKKRGESTQTALTLKIRRTMLAGKLIDEGPGAQVEGPATIPVMIMVGKQGFVATQILRVKVRSGVSVQAKNR